jgi:adenylate kinase family enzyme
LSHWPIATYHDLQTTTGTVLAALLGVPHISLDELYWQPGWIESTEKEFQAKIRQKVNENNNGWVVDGDYESRGGDIIFS